MDHCVGVEYMNMRATCKQCYSAAPLIKWNNETSLRRLEMYSVVSPWFVVLNRKKGIITFTDPMLGENYLMKNSQLSIADYKISCSRFGWLLLENNDTQCLVFYNPFTNDLQKLPEPQYHNNFESLCFSAPPTSVDCMVVGFTRYWEAQIHFVNQEPSWREFLVSHEPRTTHSLSFYGQDLNALCEEGKLIVFSNLGKENYSWDAVDAEAPESCFEYSTINFLAKCDQHLLLVSVDEHCWHNMSLIEAKMPQTENKIFFPCMHTNSSKMVFYSLDTCKYHTFDGENIQEYLGDFVGTTFHFSPNAWIEPSWS